MTRAGKYVFCAKRANPVTVPRAGNMQRVLSAKNVLPFPSTGKIGLAKITPLVFVGAWIQRRKKPIFYCFMHFERYS